MKESDRVPDAPMTNAMMELTAALLSEHNKVPAEVILTFAAMMGGREMRTLALGLLVELTASGAIQMEDGMVFLHKANLKAFEENGEKVPDEVQKRELWKAAQAATHLFSVN